MFHHLGSYISLPWLFSDEMVWAVAPQKSMEASTWSVATSNVLRRDRSMSQWVTSWDVYFLSGSWESAWQQTDLRFFPALVSTKTKRLHANLPKQEWISELEHGRSHKITGVLQHLSTHASTCGPFQTISAPALVRCVSVQLTTARSAEMFPATKYIQWICIPWKSKTKQKMCFLLGGWSI